MKSRIIGTLFALPFLAVGIWMLWSIGATCYDAWEMRDWVPVDARLISAGYETNSGDDSETFRAYARYTYEYAGETHTGDRAAIARGSDNIGDFQRQLGARLSAAMARAEPISIWVDPSNPANSIVDRSIRWGLLGFKSIFLLVFGGIGLGLIIVVWRAPRERDRSLPEFEKSPWLVNDKWQTESIRSNSQQAMWGAWAFAAFWSLISAPLPFLVYEEILDKQNYAAYFGLLFPLVGIGLLVWAIRRTREWRRFGATPVVLDPFPGSIGGHVGGTVDIRLPFDSRNRFVATLTCLDCYMSGSGKNRSRREKALWQDELVAHASSGPTGTRVTFRFDVPEGLRESEAEWTDDSQNVWRLNLHASLPDADLDRSFDIPVYATATESRLVPERTVAALRAESETLFDEAVRASVPVVYDGMRKKLLYPMGRHLGPNLGGLIVGAIFAAAGAYLIVKEGMPLFGALFGGAGVLVSMIAIYMALNSLEVIQEGDSIRTIRRWLGIPIRIRQMRRGDFDRFEKTSAMQTQTGGKHVMYYKVRAIDRHGGTLILGEGFRGESRADAAIRLFSREFGLDPSDARHPREPRAYEEEFAREVQRLSRVP